MDKSLQLSLRKLSDEALAISAEELGWKANAALAEIADAAEAASFTHDVKAIRDRISKLQLEQEKAFAALFPWSIVWLEGMRKTGGLVAAGQEAGTIAKQESEISRSDKLSLQDLGLDKKALFATARKQV